MLNNKKKSFVHHILWLVAFSVLFVLPPLVWPCIAKFMDTQNIENRNLAEMPDLDLSNVASFPKEFETYYDDVMPFRDILITLNSTLMHTVFRESDSDLVTMGKEDWLFINSSLDDYQRTNLYSEDELKDILSALLNAKKYCDANQIDFVLYIAPNKASIYGEDYLPGYLKRNGEISRTEQLVAYVTDHSDITVFFPQEELLEAKRTHPDMPLYFHLDTHWNNLGGYYGTKVLLEALGESLVTMEEMICQQVNLPPFDWNGYDLANMLGLSAVLTEDIGYEITGYSENQVTWSSDIREDSEGFYTFYRSKSDASDVRKIFFQRDSFGSAMLPYIATCFGEVYSPHNDFFNMEQLEQEKPDIYILEIVERGNLLQLLENSWKNFVE